MGSVKIHFLFYIKIINITLFLVKFLKNNELNNLRRILIKKDIDKVFFGFLLLFLSSLYK